MIVQELSSLGGGLRSPSRLFYRYFQLGAGAILLRAEYLGGWSVKRRLFYGADLLRASLVKGRIVQLPTCAVL